MIDYTDFSFGNHLFVLLYNTPDDNTDIEALVLHIPLTPTRPIIRYREITVNLIHPDFNKIITEFLEPEVIEKTIVEQIDVNDVLSSLSKILAKHGFAIIKIYKRFRQVIIVIQKIDKDNKEYIIKIIPIVNNNKKVIALIKIYHHKELLPLKQHEVELKYTWNMPHTRSLMYALRKILPQFLRSLSES